MQMLKCAKRDITGSTILSCAAGAHLHPGKLFKESSGRMLRWNVMR